MNKNLEGFRNTVLVRDIPEDGLHLIFEDMPDLLSDIEECRIQGPIKGEIFLYPVDRDIHLNGKVTASIVLNCDRCLEEYGQEIDTSFSYVLVPTQSIEGKKEITLDSEDMEISFYNEAEVQIGEIFREQVLLQIPVRQVCMEDCKGICPGCGVDLNKEECRCRTEILDSPFGVLRKLSEAGK